MRAWQVVRRGSSSGGSLHAVEVPKPEPGPGEVLVRVLASGVCRTDLHILQGDLEIHRDPVIPGHEVVGLVEATGPSANRFAAGDRVGIPWLGRTCGICRWCRRGDENLCETPRFTGWDVDGGYAEYLVADERFVFAVPDRFTDEEAAPLLCAGIIGYRALQRAEVPEYGRLGIYGFGGSAHLTAQLAIHRGARVHVMTRSENARRLALELGCSSAGDAHSEPPEPLDSAILFAPAGDLVPAALQALDKGGTLAIAGIHLSTIPALEYEWLFEEREVRSVTANTRADGEDFLSVAATIPIRPTTTAYPFERADQALADLADDRVDGAAVLMVSD